jgi:hypothetical protein
LGLAPIGAAISAATAADSCMLVPPATPSAAQRQAQEFGAVPNDNRDDAEAIQRALDALKPGETLWLAPGRYLVGRTLHMRRPATVLSGSNAVLHATNPDDQALVVEADDITVAGLTWTADTDGRRNAARHARIVVASDQGGGNYRSVRNATIRDNRIINAGAPGTVGANSASTVGILVLHADHFLLAGNTVVRTLADGIHISGGARNGRVLNNTVRETGDDMIAVVSYADSGTAAGNNAQRLAHAWAGNVDARLNRNILIAGNQLSGQYSGRGLSVVGGQSISIVGNTLENIPTAAGILLAREAAYQTFGVDNVLVEGNVLRDIQTSSPPYDGANKFSPDKRTGHGAIELHAALFDDEAADAKLREDLAVRNVVVRGNFIEHSSVSAVRAGVDMTSVVRATDSSGRALSRSAGNGVVENVSIQGNRFEQVKGEPIDVLSSELKSAGLHCSGNQRDGHDYKASSCKAAEPSLRKLPLCCTTDGRLQ